MLTRTRTRAVLLAFALWQVAAIATAETSITLNNSFIEKYKDRATIQTPYVVDKAHPKPNPPSKDADLHIAGRGDEIGLPTVAEIMNAVSQQAALKAIHAVEGSGRSITLSGAWRLWCEHGGNDSQVQGEPLQPFDTTNPAHVFEIHPLVTVGDVQVASGWKPIVGFTTKDAETAFTTYEQLRSDISLDEAKGTTTIVTTMAGYNYVEFRIELNEDPREVEDGHFVMATIETLDGDVLVRNRRMVFVNGTAPDAKVAALKKGAVMHVLGVPRIDLSLVAWRTAHRTDRPEALHWDLPYEMIVVATYPVARRTTTE